MSGAPAQVMVYGRPGCHLCEEAVELLRGLRSRERDFRIVEIDIEADPSLHALYLERIPVIELNGQILSELEPNADILRRSLDTLGT